jgi:hypothetical protein
VTRHIDLLGRLYVLAGGLSAVVAAALVALGIGSIALVVDASSESARLAAEVTAGAFLVSALVLALWAAANALVGAGLRRRASQARLAALVLAVLDLFILPFGTALGVYGLWVLVHHDSRLEFETASRPARA